ncbi:MAG: ATP-binding cassette domain-containing protein [Acidimicrobiia bacterium]|nr:ATP-binding cassette domain-containing protein [Acidimicrobiia bacterium]
MTENSIEIKGLRKSFGDKEVLKGIDLTVGKGKIVAILGPNGAGKTTTVKILSTLLDPDGGKATVMGFDVVKDAMSVRASIGLTGQYAAVDEYLTGRENLNLIGGLYHIRKGPTKKISEKLIKLVDLEESADKVVKSYSGGMKRRIDLAMSLIANPKVIYLDEPTTGLDPRSRIAMWKMIKELASQGTAILLTTQYMDEADYLADHIIVIDHGVVIAQGSATELKAQVGEDRLDVIISGDQDFAAALKALDGENTTVDEIERIISLPAKDGVNKLTSTLVILEKANIKVETISLRKPTLDDVFLKLTGHEAQEKVDEEKPSKRSKGKK